MTSIADDTENRSHAVLTWPLVKSTAVAGLGGLLIGFDTAVINGALLSLRAHFALSEIQVEFAASSLLYGCLFGAMAAGSLSDRYGRRSILRISGVLFLISAIFAAVPHTIVEFLLARLLGGLGIGLASTIAPLYLAEVSPREKRGSIVTLNQTAIVSGILLAEVKGRPCAEFGGNRDEPGPVRWQLAEELSLED